MKQINKNLLYRVAATFTFILSSLIIYSQDTIVLKSGKNIRVEIVEITDSEISYYELPKNDFSKKIKLHRMFIDSYRMEVSEETISSENNIIQESSEHKYYSDDNNEKTDPESISKEKRKEIEMQKIYDDKSIFNNNSGHSSKSYSRIKEYALRGNPLHLLKFDLKVGVEWPIHSYRSVEIEAGIRAINNLFNRSDNVGFLNITARSKYFMKNNNPSDDGVIKIPKGLYYALVANGGTGASGEGIVGFYGYAGLDVGYQYKRKRFIFDIFCGPGLGVLSYQNWPNIYLTNSYFTLRDHIGLRAGFRVGFVL